MTKDMNQQKRVELGIFHPLILVTLFPVLTTNGFGYDSASSCDPNASRKGRAAQLLQAIPCDLSVQAYCNLPGSAYPWHAVRRFVHENQGLMRRMYGDVRHISVLKAEIDSNEIDMEDIHRTAEKYSRMNAGKKVKVLHSPYQQEYGREKNNDVFTEPHFRPTQKTTTSKSEIKTTTTISPSKTTTATTTESAKFVPIKTTIKPMFFNATLDNIISDVTESSAKLNKSKVIMNSAQTNTVDIEKLSTIAILETNETLLGNASMKEIKGVNSVAKLSTNAETNETSVAEESSTEASTTSATLKTSDASDGLVESSKENMIITASEQVSTTTKETVKITKNTSKPLESQLFQDVAQKEQPLAGIKGVNACPVKEEVVAPFWANNTRGEVLALLNLYPFEQYVHWEKCAYEFKQMYCREGCRCEQQYRLHRLLAYDPHNECRGIFSDWFRFPSCCICKCYDIPYDFRVTSRSPRTIIKDSIQDVEGELQNAIYDHAADEWYRPKNKDVNDP